MVILWGWVLLKERSVRRRLVLCQRGTPVEGFGSRKSCAMLPARVDIPRLLLYRSTSFITPPP